MSGTDLMISLCFMLDSDIVNTYLDSLCLKHITKVDKILGEVVGKMVTLEYPVFPSLQKDQGFGQLSTCQINSPRSLKCTQEVLATQWNNNHTRRE